MHQGPRESTAIQTPVSGRKLIKIREQSYNLKKRYKRSVKWRTCSPKN